MLPASRVSSATIHYYVVACRLLIISLLLSASRVLAPKGPACYRHMRCTERNYVSDRRFIGVQGEPSGSQYELAVLDDLSVKFLYWATSRLTYATNLPGFQISPVF